MKINRFLIKIVLFVALALADTGYGMDQGQEQPEQRGYINRRQNRRQPKRCQPERCQPEKRKNDDRDDSDVSQSSSTSDHGEECSVRSGSSTSSSVKRAKRTDLTFPIGLAIHLETVLGVDEHDNQSEVIVAAEETAVVHHDENPEVVENVADQEAVVVVEEQEVVSVEEAAIAQHFIHHAEDGTWSFFLQSDEDAIAFVESVTNFAAQSPERYALFLEHLARCTILSFNGPRCLEIVWSFTEIAFPNLKTLIIENSAIEDVSFIAAWVPTITNLTLHSCRNINWDLVQGLSQQIT